MKLRNKINKFRRMWKHSEETVFIYSELKKRDKAYEAMEFHNRKIIVETTIAIVLAQIALILLFELL
jgi:hypothetical protein